MTPGTRTSIVDDGTDLSPAGLDPTKAYSWTVTAVYPDSIAISGSGSGSGGSGSGSGGGSGGSGGASTGPGTGASSDPSDDYTGNIGDLQTNIDGNNVTLTWTYQGSATFEIEEKDNNNQGTNYYYVESTAGRSVTIGLSPGANVGIRFRANRSDGTVSDYSTTSANIPPTPTPPPSSGSSGDSNLSTPSVSMLNDQSTTPGFWYGSLNVAVNPSSLEVDSYTITRAKDSLNVEQDVVGGVVNNVATPATWAFDGTSGATYMITFVSNDGSNLSSPSSPVSFKVPGSLPPQLSLKVGPPDASGNPTVTWTPPSGITSGSVSFFRMGTQNGKPTAIPLPSASSASLTSGEATLGGLPAGTNTIFAIYNCGYTGNPQYAGISPYSNDVTVTATGGAPAAPAKVWGTYIPGTGGAPGYVKLHWTNSSKNEAFFEVWGMHPIDGGSLMSGYEQLADVAYDKTEFVDKGLGGEGSWVYEVRAVNRTGHSAFAPSNLITAIGGPNITQHLISIRNSLFKFGNANPANMALLTTLLNNASLASQLINWDISALSGHNPYVSTPNNDGKLPDGSPTCTVAGSVYYDYDVNYWLYGSWIRLVGDSYAYADGKIRLYRAGKYLGGSTYFDGPAKVAWFEAGYDGNFGGAASTALGGVAPGTSDPGPLGWRVGDPNNAIVVSGSN